MALTPNNSSTTTNPHQPRGASTAMHETPEEITFIDACNAFGRAVHRNARDKGFWDTDRSDAEAIALMHSELSEALESIRHGHPPDHHCPEFTNTEVEFADLMIRALDTCKARGYRVAEAMVAKAKFNAGRDRLHGKKF